MTRIITHHQPTEPPATPRKWFTLNHRLLPAWPNLPRLLEQPAGRLVINVAMHLPHREFDPEETILSFGSLA